MKLTQEVKDKIIELAHLKLHKEIAEIVGMHQQSVSKFLKKEGIHYPKSRVNLSRRALNADYFKNIDTHEKAYWLGYICADGCVRNRKCGLISKDKEIIEKFKTAIESDHAITHNKIFDKRTGRTHENYSIQITSEYFTNNIIAWGIGLDKSKNCSFPKIDKNFYCSFIAGLFDGDGSVCFQTNKKQLRMNLIAPKEMLNFILTFLDTELVIKSLSMTNIKNNLYKMHLYKDTMKFLSFIYSQNPNLYLQRKYNKYYEQKKEDSIL